MNYNGAFWWLLRYNWTDYSIENLPIFYILFYQQVLHMKVSSDKLTAQPSRSASMWSSRCHVGVVSVQPQTDTDFYIIFMNFYTLDMSEVAVGKAKFAWPVNFTQSTTSQNVVNYTLIALLPTVMFCEHVNIMILFWY